MIQIRGIMETHQRKLQIILTILAVITMTCNLPTYQGASEIIKQEEIPDNTEIITNDIVLVNQRTFTEYPEDFFLSEGSSVESTINLMIKISEEGYEDIGEGGIFEYSDGTEIHAVSYAGKEKNQVILMEIESPIGNKEALLVDVLADNTLRIRDEYGELKLILEEDGAYRIEALDVNGNPITDENTSLMRSTKNACLSNQTSPACTTGIIHEIKKCFDNNVNKLLLVETTCATTIIAASSLCGATFGLGCAAAVMAALFSCGLNTKCSSAFFDDPPTYEIRIPDSGIEDYKYCLDSALVEESLYKVFVRCTDDRLPLPQFVYVTVSSGEVGSFTCTDCSGQTTQGEIPPIEPKVTECKYGCLNFGKGDARCRKEDEAKPPDEENQPIEEAEENQTIEVDDDIIIVADGVLINADPRVIYLKENAEIAFHLEGGRASGEIKSIWETKNKSCPNNHIEQTFKLEGVYEPETGFTGVADLTGNSTTYDAYCNQSTREINNSEFVWWGDPVIKDEKIGSYFFTIIMKGPISEAVYNFLGY